MIDLNTAVFGGLFSLLGAVALYTARKTRARSTELTEAIGDHEHAHTDGADTPIKGPVEVTEPAVPERVPPGNAGEDDDSPALWAWRVCRKKHRGDEQSQSRWETIESGLALGDFTVRGSHESIRVDAASLTTDQSGLLHNHDDPFKAENCYFGDPDEDISLGESDPLTKQLQKWGILGEDGLLGDIELTINIGRSTLTPDRYQATVVRDGDELLVRGEVQETQDGTVLRGTTENPPLVATNDYKHTGERIRSTARKQAAVGVVLVLIGGGIVVSGLL